MRTLSSDGVHMNTLGDRIRLERKRLGLSQEAFGALGKVRKQAQIKYEKGARRPNSEYFEGIAAAGADVDFILTGHDRVFREVLEDVATAVSETAGCDDHSSDATRVLSRYDELRTERRRGQAATAVDEREAKLLTSFRRIPEEGKAAVEAACFAIERAILERSN